MLNKLSQKCQNCAV